MTTEQRKTKTGNGGAAGQRSRPHAGGGDNGNEAAAAAFADPRFAHIASDPRFSRFPRASRTVEVDERFAGALVWW